MNTNLYGVFSTPIYKKETNYTLNQDEINFVQKCKVDSHRNQYNLTSNNSYILNGDELLNPLKLITESLKEYIHSTICPKDDIKFYITQSWLNFTEKNEQHHLHSHSNSLISGVFYIDANSKYDSIIFLRPEPFIPLFDIQPKEYNEFNGSEMEVSVSSGDIIIFPSNIKHTVKVKETDGTRCSLAFNVFAKGLIGSEMNLNAVYL